MSSMEIVSVLIPFQKNNQNIYLHDETPLKEIPARKS
jgi:hypothetical protein